MNRHPWTTLNVESEPILIILFDVHLQRRGRPTLTLFFDLMLLTGTSGGALYNDGGVLVVRDCYGSNNTAPFGASARMAMGSAYTFTNTPFLRDDELLYVRRWWWCHVAVSKCNGVWWLGFFFGRVIFFWRTKMAKIFSDFSIFSLSFFFFFRFSTTQQQMVWSGRYPESAEMTHASSVLSDDGRGWPIMSTGDSRPEDVSVYNKYSGACFVFGVHGVAGCCCSWCFDFYHLGF